MKSVQNCSFSVKIIDYFDFNKKLHIIIEYWNGDNLQKYI